MAYKVQHLTISMTFDNSGDTTASAAIPAGWDGWCQLIYFAMPSLSANVSGDIDIYDAKGNKIYTGASNVMSAAGTSAIAGLNIPIEGGGTFLITLSGIPGSAAGASAAPGTATVDLYMSA